MEEQHPDEKHESRGEIGRQEETHKIPSRARWFFAGAGALLALEMILLALLYVRFWRRAESSALPPRAPEASDTASAPPSLPEFPWPPPRASAETVIPSEFLRKPGQLVLHLGDVDHILVSGLDANGYYDRSYYAVPDGFALVTRLEQINPDGTPKTLPSRWNLEVEPLRRFSLSKYFQALFTASPGDYRIIVFIITSHPFAQTDAKVSEKQALNWLEAGFERLPPEVEEVEYTREYGCTALVYEFRLASRDVPPTLELPSRLPGRTHLERANIWSALSK